MLEKVRHDIEKFNLIERGDTVVVGLSGGPDSVCLLHILSRFSSECGWKIYAYHLNHCIRGTEADLDEAYVSELCTRWSIPLKKERKDVGEYARNRGQSLEEAGRDIRYDRLEAFADEVKASGIAVAHNRNDQAETVLMHLMRGSGLGGLTGMEYRRGRVIRPLLAVSREEIEVYCAQNGLEPRTDSSNLSCVYTRNKVRLDLIPYINKQFETDIVENVVRMSELLKLDHHYLEAQAQQGYQHAMAFREEGRVRLDTEILKGYHPAMVNRILRMAVADVYQQLKGIESKHIELLKKLAFDSRTGAVLCLPGDVYGERSYRFLEISTRKPCHEDSREYCHPVWIPGRTVVPEMEGELEAELIETGSDVHVDPKTKPDAFTQFFDYEKLEMGINIRSRKAGDVFKPLKSNGTKKLKDYLIDRKIPRQQRELIPVIAREQEVIWLVGHKISDKFRATENTKYILKLAYYKTGGRIIERDTEGIDQQGTDPGKDKGIGKTDFKGL